MTNDERSNKRTAIQSTLDAVQDELERIEGVTTPEDIAVKDVTSYGSATIELYYHDLGEDVQ